MTMHTRRFIPAILLSCLAACSGNNSEAAGLPTAVGTPATDQPVSHFVLEIGEHQVVQFASGNEIHTWQLGGDLHGHLEARLLRFHDGKEESLGFSHLFAPERRVPERGQLVLLDVAGKGDSAQRLVEFKIDVGAQEGMTNHDMSTSTAALSSALLQTSCQSSAKTTLSCETGKVAAIDTWSATYCKDMPREGNNMTTSFWELRRLDLLKRCVGGVEGLALVVSVMPIEAGK